MIVLKFPGGKARVAKSRILGKYAPPQWGEFRDVFCGACCMLPHLPPDKGGWFNDLDPWIFEFWSAVQSDGRHTGWIDRFLRMKKDTNHSATLKEKQFYASKWVLRDAIEDASKFDPADYLYVRRLAHRQVVRRHRKGIASIGKYQIRDGLNPVTRESILASRERLQTVKITQLDYWDVMSDPTKGVAWSLADPPYNIIDHDSGFYDIPFEPDQHEVLRDNVAQLDPATHPVLVTVEDSEITRSLYLDRPQFCVHRESLRYSMTRVPQRGGTVSQKEKWELWITNY